MGKIADVAKAFGVGQEQLRQMLAFDTELEQANDKVRRLEAKVLDLEKQVEPLQRNVERLEKRVEEESAKAARAEKLGAFKANKVTKAEEEHLDETDEKILKLLSLVEFDKMKPPYLEEMAKALKLNSVRTEVILGRLRDRKYILWIGISGSTPKFLLADRGKQYLVDKGIL